MVERINQVPPEECSENLSSTNGQKILRSYLKIAGRHPEMFKRNENAVFYSDGSVLYTAFSVGNEPMPVLSLKVESEMPVLMPLAYGGTLSLPVDRPARIHKPGESPVLANEFTLYAYHQFLASHKLSDIEEVRPLALSQDRAKAEEQLKAKRKSRD